MSLRLFSRAWQEITKKYKKNYTIRVYFTPMPGGPCWADCSKFLHVGWHPRRNHTYQILSRSCRGLQSYGGPKSGFSYSFSNRSYNSVSHYRATLWCTGLWSRFLTKSRISWIKSLKSLNRSSIEPCTPKSNHIMFEANRLCDSNHDFILSMSTSDCYACN